MIHVCSLARLHDTVQQSGALDIVTLLKHTDRVERPSHISEANHLILGLDDITAPMDGYISHRPRASPRVGHGNAQCAHRLAGGSHARPRRPHGGGDGIDRAGRNGL